MLWWPPDLDTDLRNIHAKASPTLQVQTRIAAIFGGSQEPLVLMLEGATEDRVLHDMQRLEPALMALVEEGLLAVTSPESLSTPIRMSRQRSCGVCTPKIPTCYCR